MFIIFNSFTTQIIEIYFGLLSEYNRTVLQACSVKRALRAHYFGIGFLERLYIAKQRIEPSDKGLRRWTAKFDIFAGFDMMFMPGFLCKNHYVLIAVSMRLQQIYKY